MEQKEKVNMEVLELSREELENTFGGRTWWEIRAINQKLVFILHIDNT